MSNGYNGWANYETWNVALWIGNDKGLYNMARGFAHDDGPYSAFASAMRELGGDIGHKTPDGVAWNDSGLDVAELDDMISKL